MPTVMTRSIRGYTIQRVVGRGGMATVYLARQPDLNRLVALKELGGLRTGEPSAASRFLREARVAGSLSHPNIVTVHDFFEHRDIPYIAMEFVPGGTLRPQMEAPSLAEIAGMLENVLAGLAHAERQGIVHRDLKPENLMVTSDGRVKIADFGIAKATGALQTGSFRTETGTTIGTPAYIAPEQAMGAEVGPWSDLYSLGVIVFEMLVGRTPFYDSNTPMAMAVRHINEAIPTVAELRPDVDPEVSQWVERMLVKDPSQRTQSASDAWDEFEDLAIGLLGPRWRDGAALVGVTPGADTAELEGPYATEGTQATRALTRTGIRPGRQLRDTGFATEMPRRTTTQPAASPRRRRTPLAVLAAMTFLAIAAGAAAFAGGGGGGGGQGGGSQAAASPNVSSSTPSSGSPASGSTSPASDSIATTAVLDDLRRATQPGEAALAAASTPREQSQAATGLAADYEGAADKLAVGGTDPGVTSALRQIGAAYRMAGAAALRGDAVGFRAAGANVDDGRKALDQALAGVPAGATVPPPASQQPAVSGGSTGSSSPGDSSGSGGSTGSSSGSGGSGGANENEPDENDNGN